jgi:transposase
MLHEDGVQGIDQVTDLDTAKQMLSLYAKENARLSKRIMDLTRQLAAAHGKSESEQLQLELSELREQLANFQHKVFGDSSEKRSRETKPKKPASKPKRGHGHREQPQLRTQSVLMELPESDRDCPACGEPLQPMKGVTEDSEVIAALEREYWKIVAMRQKYRCKCNGAIVTAPGPYKAIEGGRYTLQFAVQVAIDKYADHLPLERQVRIMARQGLVIDSQTLWDQLDVVAAHLVPTYDALREYILGADVIGADETWWRLMQKKSNKKWYAWGITTHDACWYRIADSRSAKIAAEVLDGYEGTVLCDGYKAYKTVATASPSIRLAHCWAHARRKFVEAEPNYPVACAEALDKIGRLFEIEAGLASPDNLDGEEKEAALALRKQQRDAKSRPLLEELKSWALVQRGLPQSGLRKAIDYMLEYWQGLTAFLEDPHLDIHNNQTERALRGMVIGRKNHYGSRSERGTKVAAIFYSLVESAKLCGVDPSLYLMKAAERAIDQPGAVLFPHELVP